MLIPAESSLPDKLVIAQVELNFLNRSVLFFEESVITTGLEFNLLAVLMLDAGSLVPREFIAQCIFQRQLGLSLIHI